MINGQDLINLGFTPGPIFPIALKAAELADKHGFLPEEIDIYLRQCLEDPEKLKGSMIFGQLCTEIINQRFLATTESALVNLFDAPVKTTIYGTAFEDECLRQIQMAGRLPISVKAALMPDGHAGYGLPIGGVLATRDAVIPYGVGVDIACRMSLSIIKVKDPHKIFEHHRRHKLVAGLVNGTRFGVGAHWDFAKRPEHPVMDDPAWNDLPKPIQALKDLAWSQLGTSGSGNHFAEFGEFALEFATDGLAPDRYLALMCHSGSRKLGGTVADHFTRIAIDQCQLPSEAKRLAWLSLKGEAGQLYWMAMELCGRYSAACHEIIHERVLEEAGLSRGRYVSHHHNFAWKEIHDGEEVIVHRKGATPAHEGVLGIIPGSMGDSAFLVRGKGRPDALCSASHGAGRRMSRKAAKQSISKQELRDYLDRNRVELIAGGLDESPQAYKRIEQVMAAQEDLVGKIGEFKPRIVLMSSDTRSED